MACIHVIGAGMAGLSCALRLASQGRQVRVYEASGQVGGRCRSYYDSQLDRVVDNGNHLLLSGNRAALAYLDAIGTRATLSRPPEACFPFLDLKNNRRWRITVGSGRLPLWLLKEDRRVPGAGAAAHLREMLRLLRAGPDATVTEALTGGRTKGSNPALWRGLWEPLTAAILNTPPDQASARLLAGALRETLLRGGAHCRPMIAAGGLSASFVEPAVARLAEWGGEIVLRSRLRALTRDGERVRSLNFTDSDLELPPEDSVVLAVPAAVAGDLLPGLETPDDWQTIVNAHIRLPHRSRLPRGLPFLGLLGGTAQWLFLRGDVASLTVSAGNHLVEEPAEALAAAFWQETAQALGLDSRLQPPVRLVKERRATFTQSPQQLRARPQADCGLANLLLAGDWTDTGLPASIEGAIRSGAFAAGLLLQRQ